MTRNSSFPFVPSAVACRRVALACTVLLASLALARPGVAAPNSKSTVTAAGSAMAHIDVTRLDPHGKAASTQRLSVQVIDGGAASELEMEIGGTRYELKVGAHVQEGARIADVYLRLQANKEAGFQLSTHSTAVPNKTVVLAKNALMEVSLTME